MRADFSTHNSYLNSIFKRTPYIPFPSRWFVAAGRKVVPGSVYTVAVQTLHVGADEKFDMMFRASLLHNGNQITAAKTLLVPQEISKILLAGEKSGLIIRNCFVL